ncbi:MAG: Zn-dependent hydrolase [Deltaproteobacteria bacterium]|nr:Zn-dependent hydrolase [Deltaproteobacteria bacterium]
MPTPTRSLFLLLTASTLVACGAGAIDNPEDSAEHQRMHALLDQYATVRLEADVSHLSANDQEVVRLLIQAVQPMEEVFWYQTYGDANAAAELARGDPATLEYLGVNFGPWDRLRGDEAFIEGIGAKPAGANLYPRDMTPEEFDAAVADNPELGSLYTLVRRDESGGLIAVPYHEQFAQAHADAGAKLREASELASDPQFANYLRLRADALETDDYRASDMAWMDMKDNPIDVVIGPIETYEDQLYGYKAAHEGYVLIKDMAWSGRLSRFAALLPSLQRGLPVDARYKAETPGTDSDLNAYDVVYYAGDANAGAKTIAINLPNDEQVQLAKGTRRLQLKNAMQAKFDEIMVPLAEQLIAEDQRDHVTFDAFFGNTMFHEVAHGLGIKNTLNDRGTVRTALREHASPMEEGKADVVGLYMVTQLFERGELTEGSIEDHYVTFLAGIFRSVRFGASSAHGQANMVRFNYFQEEGAFTRDAASGTYRVDFEAMRAAVDGLSELILTLQGDGNYEGVDELMLEKGLVPPELQGDLDRLDALGIPRDIVFEQGIGVLFGR